MPGVGSTSFITPEVRRAAENALAAINPVREATSAIKCLLVARDVSTSSVPELPELLSGCRTMTAACELSIRATDGLWESFLRALQAPTQIGDAQFGQLSEEQELIRGAQDAQRQAISSIDQLRREFGQRIFRAVSDSDVLNENELLSLGSLAKEFVTDSIPYYGTLTELMRQIGVGDIELLWMELAGPARRSLAFKALERASLQSSIAFEFLKFTFEALSLTGEEKKPAQTV